MLDAVEFDESGYIDVGGEWWGNAGDIQCWIELAKGTVSCPVASRNCPGVDAERWSDRPKDSGL